MKTILYHNRGIIYISIVLIGIASGVTIYAGYQLTNYSNILSSNTILEGIIEALKIVSWCILAIILTYFSSVYQAFATRKLNLFIRNKIVEKIISLNTQEYEKNGFSYYSSWLINDVLQIETNTVHSFFK